MPTKKDAKDVAKYAAGAYIGTKLANRKPQPYEDTAFGQAEDAAETCIDLFGADATIIVRLIAAVFCFAGSFWLLATLGASIGLCVVLSIVAASFGLLFGPFLLMGLIGLAAFTLFIWILISVA